MKNIKYIIAIILFSCFFTSYSQNKNSRKKSKDYVTYMCMKIDTMGKTIWEKKVIDKKLLALQKEGKLEGIQYQLKDKGYDVDITGCLDKKTIKAWDENKINEKKAKKIAKKKRRIKHKK